MGENLSQIVAKAPPRSSERKPLRSGMARIRTLARAIGSDAVAQIDVVRLTLRSRGVPVRELRVDGVIHGHLNWLPGPELPQVGQTLDFLAAAVNELTATHQQARVALTKEQPCP